MNTIPHTVPFSLIPVKLRPWLWGGSGNRLIPSSKTQCAVAFSFAESLAVQNKVRLCVSVSIDGDDLFQSKPTELPCTIGTQETGVFQNPFKGNLPKTRRKDGLLHRRLINTFQWWCSPQKIDESCHTGCC